jgi:hypothetical protein
MAVNLFPSLAMTPLYNLLRSYDGLFTPLVRLIRVAPKSVRHRRYQ